VKSRIQKGLCLFVGIEKGDREIDAEYLTKKIVELRIFSDQMGKMNLSLQDAGGAVLVVSQFTLAGSLEKGRRPSFDKAETPDKAERLFNNFVSRLRDKNIITETGVFGAVMEVNLVNDGPVTFYLEMHSGC